MAPTVSTMRAWTYSHGGPVSQVLRLSTTTPVPTLAHPTDVLIRISHAALNPGSAVLINWSLNLFFKSSPIPEFDFSGTIVSVGSSVPLNHQDLSPGTQVFGAIGPGLQLRGVGSLAEYVVVPATSVMRMPEGVGAKEAAGLGIAGCTALPLIEEARLKRGDSVLVNGASGGVGSTAVQLAKHAVGESGRVIGICSGRNAELVKSLGADEVIDYQANAPLYRYLATHYSGQRFSAIIDAHGTQDLYTHCADYLILGNPFLSVGVSPEGDKFFDILYSVFCMLKNSWLPKVLGGVSREYHLVNGFATQSKLEQVKKLVEEGVLKPVIDSCWDMEDVPKAFDKLMTKRARGKIIIKVQDI